MIGHNQHKDLTQMKMIYVTKWAVVIACIGFMALASQVRATALGFGDTFDLGTVLYGIPSGDADRTSYVNELISLAPGTTFFDPVTGQTYTRSLSVHGAPYPAAVFGLNGNTTTINLGTTGYQYLFAKYDGPNAGSEVWDVNGLLGIITIPANGLAGQNYGLSGWTLFSGTGGNSVPDGGSTVMLLGAALTGLGVARRYVKH
jgi:VPDSG-CTERM motif